MRQLPWRDFLEEMRRLWLAARRRHRFHPEEEPPLRPFLDETVSAWPFSAVGIELSPACAGVYLLYCTGRLNYIGLAVDGRGIRQELERHRRGDYGSCTQGASAFLYHVDPDPIALHRRFLRAHRERYGGRLPACNESPPCMAQSPSARR